MRIYKKATIVISAITLLTMWGASASANHPSIEHDTFLNAVAPVSKTSAYAVGTTLQNERRYVGFIQHWDGTTWSNVYVYAPPRSDSGGLYAIGAVGDADVWAAGYYDINSENERAAVVHWDGSSWKPLSTHGLDLGWNCQLSGVAALSSDDVWLLGSSYPSNKYKAIPIALHWDGTSLSRVDMPPPPKGQGFISAVSAASPSNIWAVGSVLLAGPRETTFIEHWDGTSWSQVASPRGADISGVYASGPKTGWAVEGGSDLLRLSDGAWHSVTPPKAFDGVAAYAITGTSDHDVWVVGNKREGNTSQTATLHWDGSKWSRIDSPTQGKFADLNGVGTDADGDLWAVGGHTFKGSDDQRPIRELWNGSKWVLR